MPRETAAREERADAAKEAPKPEAPFKVHAGGAEKKRGPVFSFATTGEGLAAAIDAKDGVAVIALEEGDPDRDEQIEAYARSFAGDLERSQHLRGVPVSTEEKTETALRLGARQAHQVMAAGALAKNINRESLAVTPITAAIMVTESRVDPEEYYGAPLSDRPEISAQRSSLIKEQGQKSLDREVRTVVRMLRDTVDETFGEDRITPEEARKSVMDLQARPDFQQLLPDLRLHISEHVRDAIQQKPELAADPALAEEVRQLREPRIRPDKDMAINEWIADIASKPEKNRAEAFKKIRDAATLSRLTDQERIVLYDRLTRQNILPETVASGALETTQVHAIDKSGGKMRVRTIARHGDRYQIEDLLDTRGEQPTEDESRFGQGTVKTSEYFGATAHASVPDGSFVVVSEETDDGKALAALSDALRSGGVEDAASLTKALKKAGIKGAVLKVS